MRRGGRVFGNGGLWQGARRRATADGALDSEVGTHIVALRVSAGTMRMTKRICPAAHAAGYNRTSESKPLRPELDLAGNGAKTGRAVTYLDHNASSPLLPQAKAA